MKLRTGDVVRHNETGAEHRVLDVGAEAVVVTWNNAYATCGADSLTLLRRPVQVGDVIVADDGTQRMTVASVGSRLFRTTTGGYVRFDQLPGLWGYRHENGTPIEPLAIEPAIAAPPQRLAETRTLPVRGSGVTVAPSTVPAWAPEADAIARGLFATDPDVLAVVLPQADATLVPVRGESTSLRYEGSPMHVEWKVEKADPARVKAALDRAWRRDELGRATHWRKRVAEALEKIGGGS